VRPPRSARRVLLVGVVMAALTPACSSSATGPPPCDDPSAHIVVLIAQSVPSATLIPCIRAMPSGWTFGGGSVSRDLSRMWLSSAVAGVHAVEISLSAACDPGADAVETVPGSGEAGTRVFQGPQSLDPFRWTRYVTFPGGCVVFEYAFTAGAPAALSLVANDAVSFIPRGDVVAAVRDDVGETLCGAEAPPCLAG
jgi:hypothetical protein